MWSSFEELDARILNVKTDLNSDAWFESYSFFNENHNILNACQLDHVKTVFFPKKNDAFHSQPASIEALARPDLVKTPLDHLGLDGIR